SLANRKGAIQSLRGTQRSIEHIQQGDDPARAKVTMLIQKQNRLAQFDLPLNQCSIEQLALEASVRGQTVADLIGKIVRQVVEKDLSGKILRIAPGVTVELRAPSVSDTDVIKRLTEIDDL